MIIDDEICSGNTIMGIVNYLFNINEYFDIHIFIAHCFLHKDFFLKKSSKDIKTYCTNSVDYCYKITNQLIIKDISKLISKT